MEKKELKKYYTDQEIEEQIKKFDEKIEEQKEQAGEIEVRDAILDKAMFLKNDAMDYVKAEKVFREAYDKSGGPSKKMEILFEILMMNIEKIDLEDIKKDIAKCKQLVEEGADWDKKNKLKIFEGVYCMMVRDLQTAANLFLSSIATFTCTELMTYQKFIFYAVVTSMVSVDRQTLRKDVVHSPDVLATIRDIPNLKQFLDSLYNCNYKQFFQAFVEIIDQVKEDIYLGQHVNYFMKQMRLVAYRQYLESFKSVTIDNMAKSFGVSSDFIDKELSNFIYQGKINCKIDKVTGVIESNRQNKKNIMFNNMIKQGDHLLNRMQKLGRILDI